MLATYDPQMKRMVPTGTYDVWIAPNAAAEGVAGSFQVVPK